MLFSRHSLSVDMPRLWVLVMVLGLRFVSGSLPHRHLSVLVDRRGRFYSFHTLPSLLSLPLASPLARQRRGSSVDLAALFTARLTSFSLSPFLSRSVLCCCCCCFANLYRKLLSLCDLRSFALLKQWQLASLLALTPLATSLHRKGIEQETKQNQRRQRLS